MECVRFPREASEAKGDDAREAKGDDGDDDDEPSETETDVARARPKAFARTVCDKSQDRGGDEPSGRRGSGELRCHGNGRQRRFWRFAFGRFGREGK